MEPTSESLALLSRLSAKPGVQSTLVLSRVDGAILRSEGLLARNARKRASSRTQDQINGRTDGSQIGEDKDDEETESASGRDIARTVWRFVKATEGMVGEMDADDELRLLRVRTKKNELVIVPSECYDFRVLAIPDVCRCEVSTCCDS
jgi:dynein light chain roadblock-type